MKRFALLFLKGLSMGMADVIPGVSGGTIAFITGIYEELVESIGKLDAKALRVLFSKGPIACFKHINGAFLLSVASGIAVSIIGLARFITGLMENEPIKLWSFFFGLIIASAVFIGKDIKWSVPKNLIALVIGAVAAYFISIASPTTGEVGLVYVFFSGAIAICAMILPGISGSFILLLLGSYATIFGAIGGLSDAPVENLPVIMVFLVGAFIGLLSFAKLLKWLFAHYRNLTMALLTGFMIGSLSKVWPWKEVLSYRINSKGESVPFLESNISPGNYELLIGQSPELFWAIGLALVGMGIVWALSYFSPEAEAQ